MQRLLMGEVGSGKTVVALYAMLRAVEHGYQGALMAPTETLAEQHFQTIDSLLAAELPVALLTGSTPGRRRAEIAVEAPVGRAQPDSRYARADRGGRRIRAAWRGGGRRAAPVRSSPAGGARFQGLGWRAARPSHDRDPDPADARAVALRRPRLHCAARAAARTPADPDVRLLDRGRAVPGVRADPRGAPSRPPGVRGVPARRGVGAAPGARGDGGVRAAARGRAPRVRCRAAARPDAPGARSRRRWPRSPAAAPMCSSPRP